MKLFERDENMAMTAPGGGVLLAIVPIVVLHLVGCESALQPSGAVRDTTGQGRNLSDYHNDVAGCDREVAMAASGAYRPAPYPNVTRGDLRGAGRALETPGTAFGGPNTEALWQKCMRTRGWAPA